MGFIEAKRQEKGDHAAEIRKQLKLRIGPFLIICCALYLLSKGLPVSVLGLTIYWCAKIIGIGCVYKYNILKQV